MSSYLRLSAFICGCLCAAQVPRAIQYRDLSPPVRQILGTSEQQFDALIGKINQETSARLAEGESDHLIYYLLQSERFTRRPRIEPALSAKEFVEDLDTGVRAAYLAGATVADPARKIPVAVQARMRDFLAALDTPQSDERLAWFRKSRPASERTVDYLCGEYVRTMRFLYRKEWAGEGGALYQQRGHSSDTSIESSFAVWNALQVVKALDPTARIHRVLVVGDRKSVV